MDFDKYPVFEQEIIRAIEEALVETQPGGAANHKDARTTARKAGVHVAKRIRDAASSFLADSAGPSSEHGEMLLTWLGGGMRAQRERQVENDDVKKSA